MKKPIVNTKEYKNDTHFSKIVCGSKESFVLGSDNGDIRFFKDSFSIAWNLLPSYQGDAIISIDTSMDNSLVLVTFKNYLILIETELKNKQSLFYNNIKNEEKPVPRILKVNPKVLINH